MTEGGRKKEDRSTLTYLRNEKMRQLPSCPDQNHCREAGS